MTPGTLPPPSHFFLIVHDTSDGPTVLDVRFEVVVRYKGKSCRRVYRKYRFYFRRFYFLYQRLPFPIDRQRDLPLSYLLPLFPIPSIFRVSRWGGVNESRTQPFDLKRRGSHWLDIPRSPYITQHVPRRQTLTKKIRRSTVMDG